MHKSLGHMLLAVAAAVTIIAQSFGNVALAKIEQPALRVPPLENVHCASYCVYDRTTNEIILGTETDKRVYPASQTKIMTCQIALDYLNTDDYLTVSQNAMNNITSDSSVMGISVGEILQISELLYGLMLPSGNDAANVLAEGVVDAMFENYPANGTKTGPDGVNASYLTQQLGKTEQEIKDKYKLEAFACLMNLRAQNLGCTGTHFVNASGLHDDNHYTTTRDLTIIMAKASENLDFKKLIASPSHIYKATNRHSNDAWAYVKNSDYLVFDPWLAAQTGEGFDSHLIAIIGGKTGTTSKAGKGLTLSTVNENGHELMISICGIPSDYYYFTTMYAASVTAYGHLECWKKDPVTKYPGTTGDYRYVNAPEAQQPTCDDLIFPGDAEVKGDESNKDATPRPSATPIPTPTPSIKEKVKQHPLVLFAKDQPVAAGAIGFIFVAIVAVNIILLVRINKMKNQSRKKGGKIRKPTGLI